MVPVLEFETTVRYGILLSYVFIFDEMISLFIFFLCYDVILLVEANNFLYYKQIEHNLAIALLT